MTLLRILSVFTVKVALKLLSQCDNGENTIPKKISRLESTLDHAHRILLSDFTTMV